MRFFNVLSGRDLFWGGLFQVEKLRSPSLETEMNEANFDKLNHDLSFLASMNFEMIHNAIMSQVKRS
jgi:hypothetical protein